MKDANGIPFHLLLGRTDWETALMGDGTMGELIWDARQGAVMLAPEIRRFPPRDGAAVLVPEDRRGAAADRFGNWYWINDDRRGIRTWRPGQEASDYWHAGSLEAGTPAPTDGSFAAHPGDGTDLPDLRLSGLSVTCRHHLIVGTEAPAGLLVFDLHGAGPPSLFRWPSESEIAVFDMAPAHPNGTWLLDRTRAALWLLDDRLCLTAFAGSQAIPGTPTGNFFDKTTGPEPADDHERALGLDLAAAGITDPIAVTGLPDDTALILDAPEDAPSRIVRVGAAGALASVELNAALLDAFETPPTALQAHDIAFLADPNAPAGRVEGALYLVDTQGDQALRFELGTDAVIEGSTGDPALTLRLSGDYIPLRRFDGRGLTAHDGQVFYDIGESWTPLAAHPRRRRHTQGRFRTPIFDAKEPGTTWHRIILDACIPAGSAVQISSRAADDVAGLGALVFTPLPQPYRRAEGSEVPFWDPYPGHDPNRGTGSWETLVQSGRGRLMQLEITLTGDGSLTPKLRALRLYAPRFSYLDRYLPAAFGEDAVSASFLDRFLSNVEGLFTGMENRVASAHGLVDTRIVPDEGLDWLASWLGARLEPGWDAARRRLFIEHAELLFRWRGTPAGLKVLIDIATDPCPDRSLFNGLRSGQPPEPDSARRGVRLSENYTRRVQPAQATGTVPALEGWTAADGAGAIHLAYEAFALERRDTDLAGLAATWGRPLVAGNVQFPPLRPNAVPEQEDWLAFTNGPIGFAYATAAHDSAAAWRSFLARRYATPDRIAAAHGLSDLAQPTALPTALPPGGAYLRDWIDFVSRVLPGAEGAHQFAVLAPVDPGEDSTTRDARIAEIARIVEQERPAHTAFEVRPFWALFQTGTARLGIDTALGEGARFTAIALGQSALSEGFIGYGHPQAVTDRTVVGRNTAGEVRL